MVHLLKVLAPLAEDWSSVSITQVKELTITYKYSSL